jgi:hypothetical protein
MSGPFQRLARRSASPPSGPEPTPAPADADAPTSAIPAVQGSAGPSAPVRHGAGGTGPADPPRAPGDGAAPGADAGQPGAPADQAPADRSPEAAAAPGEPAADPAPRPSFRERARVRRRARYLRRLRELQLRDLGGLVFELHRFGRERGDLVAGKLDALGATSSELRGLEAALGEVRDGVELREPGIGGACPRCATLHGSADFFCSRCGLDLRAGAARAPDTGDLDPGPREPA